MKIGRVLGGVVVVLVIIPVIAAVVTVRFRDPSSPPRLQAHHVDAAAAACAKPPAFQHPLIGVALDTPGRSLNKFVRATRVHPQIVAQYLPFKDTYNSALARRVAGAGGHLLVQWDPKNISLQRIAHGKWDRYITKFARAVCAARVPIVLSFGHEMNGNWYTWGYTKTSPRKFIAAWRHLHRLFAKAGASNVTWCWNVNTWQPDLTGKAHYGIAPARRWWPGARYVDWIGLDAYYATPYDTFRSIFKYPLRALHRIAAHKPVLIAETAAAQGPGQARQIRSLFSGIRRTSVIGAVWFESHNSNVRENWLIEGKRAALAAFRAGARSLTLIHRSS